MITHFIKGIIHFGGDVPGFLSTSNDIFPIMPLIMLTCSVMRLLPLIWGPSPSGIQDPSPGTLSAGRAWEEVMLMAFGQWLPTG